MTEELDPMSMSDEAVRNRDLVEAYEKARVLEDLELRDVDDRRVGTIRRCFADADAGGIKSCEVRLDKDAKRMNDYPGDTVRVRYEWITDIAADAARLDHPLTEVLSGASAREHGGGGSDTFPRKTR